MAIDASEDTDPYQTYEDLISYSSTTLGYVSMFTTHTYGSHWRSAGAWESEAASQNRTLWVAEYGDNDATGMTMARRIHDDITVMGLRAWCYWQVVDSAGGWGLLLNSLLAPTNPSYTTNYTINEKYYVMGQYSEFIRPGCKIIAAGDTNTLAAYNPTNSTLVLVLVNTGTSGFNVTYNLSDFGPLLWRVAMTQTTSSEHLAALPSSVMVSGQVFTSAIPAQRRSHHLCADDQCSRTGHREPVSGDAYQPDPSVYRTSPATFYAFWSPAACRFFING